MQKKSMFDEALTGDLLVENSSTISILILSRFLSKNMSAFVNKIARY